MNKPVTVAWGLCGSFCTLGKVLPQMEKLAGQGVRILPVVSYALADTDTRFGRADSWLKRLEEICGMPPLCTLTDVEPLGPHRLADAFVVAPCTGSTLARLALGISDTPVSLGAKSMLRIGAPVLLAPSTNDGLGASAQHLATLMNRKNFYLVPLAQDDAASKPNSLQSDFSLLPRALELALADKQLQPFLL